MCSALIIDDKELERLFKALFQASGDQLREAYLIDKKVVESIGDPTYIVRKLHDLPKDIREIVSYWLQAGLILGVECRGYITPHGSVVLDLGTYRGSRSIVDFKQILNELETREICFRKGRYVYIPGMFYFSDIAIILPEESYVEKKLDEYFTMGLDVPSVELVLKFPSTFLMEYYTSIQELYAEAMRALNNYFFGTFISYVLNLTHIPSVVPVVLDTPVDLIIVTNRDVIAHKFVDIDRTLRRGTTAALKYVEYGFDKIVLVHVSREKQDRITYRRTVMNILNKRLLFYVGYVVMYGYEIDHVIVYKVPMYNKAMEYFKYTNTGLRKLLRQQLVRLR